MAEMKARSMTYSINFAINISHHVRTNPVSDLHPDGEMSLTWRSSKGIINIAFGEDGIATYAAYLVMNKETHKGRFRVSPSIPLPIVSLVRHIEYGEVT